MRQSFGARPIPTTFVACDIGRFVGTVSVIACDEEPRPHYKPWIATLWVEPEDRRRGVGAALVARAAEFAFDVGAARIHLLSRERRRTHYESLGWAVLEADAPEPGLHGLIRDAKEGTSR
ncbi:GNAT family N-acetyltransferase [Microvirga makkahensis]|uniref:GNAT family N-acetyltransferase n=1 Tax=Microvirga makkahensis TaxID=1128670 RepID=A0A7X3MWT2_9HYPH|nr:GNAT family N-acetyltransferase [Microvirga makkahensis]